MRILTRYILREVASYAVLGGVLFTFVLYMRYLPQILDLLVRDSASFTDALRIFSDLLPNTLTFTIPTAVLAGILLGLSRLAADSEVTAMRASGIGPLTFVRVVSILAFTALGVGLFNALYFAPRGAADLLNLENQLKTSQVSVSVEPRVFYENFKNYVLYVQDVRPTSNAAWHNVFLADLTQPANPNVITAEQAIVGNPGADSAGLLMHLINAGEHQISPTDPNQYYISTSSSTDLPLQLESQDSTHISRLNTHLQALPLSELWLRSRAVATGGPVPSTADVRAAKIELNTRFSYPFACLVLMLIGVPLGLSSERGGKSTGVILTLLLVFVYYFLSELGVGFARSGKLSPYVGVWAANYIFAALGVALLRQLSGGGVLLNSFTTFGASLGKHLSALAPGRVGAAMLKFAVATGKRDEFPPTTSSGVIHQPLPAHQPTTTLIQRLRRLFKSSFPLLLDEYIMRSYAASFLLSLGTFALLYVVFTFFELMGDIIHNQTPFIVVGEYLINLLPFIIDAVTPLCSLLAVLITFGTLNRTSELTAMKATGISLYRVVAPILVLAAIIAAALFAFDESYLPDANRRQEQLRAQIKDKPAQTFLLPGRQFISGQADKEGEPSRIFYYVAFDPDRQVFADLTVFEFDRKNFTLQRRIYAKTARWDPTVSRWIFENGWQRSFSGETVSSYTPFTVSTFPEIREQPGYFTKEYKPSEAMSYGELRKYIADLSQSGFDTVKLSVQLANKLSVPAMTLVMAILAVPFAVSMGRRGSLAGIATAIGVAICYWVVAGIFSSMGDINTLPPRLAAWSPDLLFAFTGSYLLLRTPT